MQEVAELSQEYQGMAQYLYSGLSRSQQETLERAALLPALDENVLGAPPASLPLADVLLDGQSQAYPSAFRRFLVAQMTERLGAQRVADTRRELAARARQSGACRLAIQVLLEGDLVAEAVELADREVEHLPHEEAAALVHLLPPDAIREHQRLVELHTTREEHVAADRAVAPARTALATDQARRPQS